MKDLLAVAAVRRILLSIGQMLEPDQLGGPLGPVTLWIAKPLAELEGRTPLELLAEPEGEDLLRAHLESMFERTV